MASKQARISSSSSEPRTTVCRNCTSNSIEVQVLRVSRWCLFCSTRDWINCCSEVQRAGMGRGEKWLAKSHRSSVGRLAVEVRHDGPPLLSPGGARIAQGIELYRVE